MLTNSEKETLILINKADSREGFFLVSTSNQSDYKRLIKRVGAANVLSVKERMSQNRTVQWEVKLPIQYLSKTTFGIRRDRGDSRRDLDDKKEQSPGGQDRG